MLFPGKSGSGRLESEKKPPDGKVRKNTFPRAALSFFSKKPIHSSPKLPDPGKDFLIERGLIEAAEEVLRL